MKPVILSAMYEYVQDDGGLPSLRRLFSQVDYQELPTTLSFFVVWSFELEPHESDMDLQFFIRVITPTGAVHDSRPRLVRLPRVDPAGVTSWTVIDPYLLTFRRAGVHQFRLVTEGCLNATVRIEVAKRPNGWIPVSD